MFLPLVYHDDYSPPFPAEHRFPMEKFRLQNIKLYSDTSSGASPCP